jgi:hypothetical protein
MTPDDRAPFTQARICRAIAAARASGLNPWIEQGCKRLKVDQ